MNRGRLSKEVFEDDEDYPPRRTLRTFGMPITKPTSRVVSTVEYPSDRSYVEH
ncbi:MAG: hypothetical protein P4L43_05220 [Syntrophobacteraceae bacterium]|nr:hypothetical protein [Syntrophobacteraceae bacterium]